MLLTFDLKIFQQVQKRIVFAEQSRNRNGSIKLLYCGQNGTLGNSDFVNDGMECIVMGNKLNIKSIFLLLFFYSWAVVVIKIH